MCEKVRTLAESNPYRRTTICEHGSVNLIWDNAALYLPLELFLEMQSSLEAHAPSILLRDSETAQEGLVTLSSLGSGVALWLGNFGFKLSLKDFMALRALLQRSVTAYGESVQRTALAFSRDRQICA